MSNFSKTYNPIHIQDGYIIECKDQIIEDISRPFHSRYVFDISITEYKGLAIKPASKTVPINEEQSLTYSGYALWLIHDNPKYNAPIVADYHSGNWDSLDQKIFLILWNLVPSYLEKLKLPYLIEDEFYQHITFNQDNFEKKIQEHPIEEQIMLQLKQPKFTEMITWKIKRNYVIAEQKQNKGGLILGIAPILAGITILLMVPEPYNLFGILGVLIGVLQLFVGFSKTTLGFMNNRFVYRKKLFFGLIKKQTEVAYEDIQLILLSKSALQRSEQLAFHSNSGLFAFGTELKTEILRTYQALFILACLDYQQFINKLENLGLRRRRE